MVIKKPNRNIHLITQIPLQEPITDMFCEKDALEAYRFHKSLPQYRPTNLISLPGLAKKLNLKALYIKDESTRFGLKAFKGLGGSYAMFRILCEQLGIDPGKADFSTFQKEEIREKTKGYTFVTATDGNHGKGVSWASGLFGCRAIVYMPKGSSEKRADAICQAGPAIVEITDWNYDKTVEYASRMSKEKGGILIQDTSWEGYEQIPKWIIQGYLTMGKEILIDIEGSESDKETEKKERPTHVFLQAGVGAMAGGICAYLINYYQEAGLSPKIIIVEPDEAACIYQSAASKDGKAHSIEGDPVTIMAGLNCGTPCQIIWPYLRDYSTAFMTIPDQLAAHAMRIAASPIENDPVVTTGESGASTLGALLGLTESNAGQQKEKDLLGLTNESVVLLINTEGDTDLETYKQIIQNKLFPE